MLAFESAETGRWEIYVVRLRDGKRVLVSTSGGRRPLWTREGLQFQSGRSVMRVVDRREGEDVRVEGLGGDRATRRRNARAFLLMGAARYVVNARRPTRIARRKRP